MTKNDTEGLVVVLALMWFLFKRGPTPDVSVGLRFDTPEYPEIDGTSPAPEQGCWNWPP